MAHEDTVQERVQELTWALVDEQIDAEELRFLESLMLSDEKARDAYVRCVHLHADLISHFAASEAPAASGKPPMLNFLSAANPPIDVQPSAQ
jgi:hypothetical protein